jgi:hypothetical protein
MSNNAADNATRFVFKGVEEKNAAFAGGLRRADFPGTTTARHPPLNDLV